MLTSRYTSLAAVPITDGDYAGPDVRYSSEFEEIENALAQEQSIHAEGGPDWPLLVAQSEQLLKTQSRDLRVACWLAWGLYRCDGIRGLLAGIALLDSLLPHWLELHPRKARTRAAALTGFSNRLEAAMPEMLACDPGDGVWQQLHEALTSLDQQLQSLLGEQAPFLQPLCRQLQARASQVRQAPTASVAPAVAQPSTLARAKADPPGEAAGGTAAESVTSAREAHKGLRVLQEQARNLCQWWQSQTIADSRAISLSRLALWLPIEALPEHDQAGKTGLRGLPADRQKSFQERSGQGQPAELLRDVESSIARAPFWLDGQHLAWRCLDELKADAARRELEQQLGSFLQRLPGVQHLQFFDGTPFADRHTLDWINSRVLNNSAGAQLLSPVDASADDPWETTLHEASALLRSDGLRAAMVPLQAGINQAQGGRAYLHWQLAIARLCMQAGKQDLARTLLEGMEQTLRDARISEWEPQLLVRVTRLLFSSYEQSGSKATRQRRDEIFQRLCHLDFDVVLEQALGP